MSGRFYLPDFEFELDEWRQKLATGEVTLEEVLQALLDHIQPIVQPELFEPLPEIQAQVDAGEAPVEYLLAATVTQIADLLTRFDQLETQLRRVEPGMARIEQQLTRVSNSVGTET